MANQHKILQSVGLAALCANIKAINATTTQLAASVVQISEAMEDLSSEVEGLINDLENEVEDLTTAVINGEVTAPMATQGRDVITTQSGVEIHAVKIW